MTTILKQHQPFPAATLAVDRAMALNGHSVVDVHPLVDELSRDFPRHQPQELSAAVITAIALRGGAMRWQAA